MPRNQLETVLSYLHRIADPRQPVTPDAQLLRRFLEQRDEAAFEAIVRRHGPMVLTACRRLLPDSNDVDDAFQATFFVLVRRAGAISRPEQLAGWLHGVAVRVANKARVARARRLAHEQTLADVPPAEATMDDTMRRELWSVLDEEVAKLPARYQAPFVLCYLAGRTNEEAAHELGHPSGTIFSRLARARDLLRARLTRRGVTLSSTTLTAALAAQPVDAALPASLLEATIQGGLLVAGGQTATLGSQAAKAVVLMQETSRTMFIAKAKLAAVWVLALVAAGSGVAVVTQRAASAKPQAEAVQVAKADEADEEALKHENAKLKKDVQALKDRVDELTRKLATVEKEALPITYKGKSKSYWLAQLRDVDRDTRMGAITALGAIAQEDSSVIPSLIDVLKSKDHQTRDHVIAVLVELGPDAKSALPQILKLVGTSTQLQPALRLIDPDGKTAIPALIQKLKDDNLEVRVEAAKWLADYGTKPKVVAALLEATKDQEAELRCEAVLALGNIGFPRAKGAMPRLVALLKDNETVNTRSVSPIAPPTPPNNTPAGPFFGPLQRNVSISSVGEAAAHALKAIDIKAAKEAGVKIAD